MDFTVSIEEKTCSQLFKRRGLHLMKPVRTRRILTNPLGKTGQHPPLTFGERKVSTTRERTGPQPFKLTLKERNSEESRK
jgi:hypothetical protein